MEQSAPLIAGFLQKKRPHASRVDPDDVTSETRVQLTISLQRLRAGGPSGLASPARPIIDFRAYVAAVAKTAWATLLRQHNPGRTMLFNRLHYLLSNATGQRGFALWTGRDGQRWAGFEAWDGRNIEASPPVRLLRLRNDPASAAAEAFGGVDCWATMKLPVLVAGLFSWLNVPLPLRDLTDAIAFLQGVSGEMAALAEDIGDDRHAALIPHDAGPSPDDALRWKEYLQWLWQTSARLTVPQRRAFLLHSHCLHEMEPLGLTSIRMAASMLELPIERMAGLWSEVPLEDRVIAGLLGVESQRVINLRKAARVILGQAWREYIS